MATTYDISDSSPSSVSNYSARDGNISRIRLIKTRPRENKYTSSNENIDKKARYSRCEPARYYYRRKKRRKKLHRVCFSPLSARKHLSVGVHACVRAREFRCAQRKLQRIYGNEKYKYLTSARGCISRKRKGKNERGTRDEN